MAKKKGGKEPAQPDAASAGSSLIICRNKYVCHPFRTRYCAQIERRMHIAKTATNLDQALALHLEFPRTMAPTTTRDPRFARSPELHDACPSPG